MWTRPETLASPPAFLQALVRPLHARLRRRAPALSDTEREALEAGGVWWDAELFSGRPDWERLLSLPPPHLSADERAFIEGPTANLCEMLDDWRIMHRDQDLPTEVWNYLKAEGFFGLVIPPRYGGSGFSALAHSQVVMRIASRSVAAAVTVMVPNSLGPGKLLLHYGTREQKAHYLPRLARGEEIPCFALTGPRAGSDAAALPDHGRVCHGRWHGRRVLGVRLDFHKRYITLAPVATLIGLAFRLQDPQHLLGDREELGITLALLPRTCPGLEIGRRHIPLGIPFQNGPIHGRGVFVPLDRIVGGRAGIGRGWAMLMETLGEGRAISLPALSVGAVKTASRDAGAYAGVRRQFGRPIGHFEGVQEALARIAGLTYRMDAARTLTLGALDEGERPAVVSALVKYHLTEGYRQAVQDAMDVLGGAGICLGPANLMARAYQAIPIAITVEGANILTRSLILFGQGALRCHPWALSELHALHDPDPQRGLAAFSQALVGHLGFLAANLGRSLGRGLGLGRRAPVAGPLAWGYRELDRLSAAFALCADIAMLALGAGLKRHERLSARLGDALAHLYLASAVLKRFEDDDRPSEDLPLARWALEDGLYRIEQALDGFTRNLPTSGTGSVLRRLALPLGRRRRPPDDRLEAAVAGILLRPGAARERLTAGIHLPRSRTARPALLEQALRQSTRCAPIERRIHAAGLSGDLAAQARQALERGLVDASEAAALTHLQHLIDRVTAVDAFTHWGHRYLREPDPQRQEETARAA